MRTIRFSACLLCVALAILPAPRARASTPGDLAKYSVFSGVDPSSLSNGKVLAARGPALSFARDLTVQALYLIHAPVARTLEMHKEWDSTRHPELKVYLHRDYSTHPTLADFTASIPENSATRKLAAATGKLPDMDDLQLSKAEAASFKGSGGGGGFPPGVRDFWSQVLYHRASAFLSQGLGGEPPYDSSEGSARVSDEVRRLLGEQPRIRAAFRPLIQQSPLGGGPGSLSLSPYWELFDVEGEGAFSLGASCSVQTGDSAQMLDLQYYGSGGYYVFMSLYQLWPVTVGGKPATLVWRVDTISSLSLSDLGPFDRMGSGAAMMKDIQRIIGFFEKDMGR
ncbi:MAG: hypothetical protein ABSE62_10900 [Chthoniobacteraceae bacterium]|jgi:hypothetical protein